MTLPCHSDSRLGRGICRRLFYPLARQTEREEVQRDFLKYTAQKARFDLLENNPELLKEFEVVASDRKYPRLPEGRSFGNAIL